MNAEAILNEAIRALKPNCPVRRYVFAGDVITLWLRDGRILEYDWKNKGQLPEIPADLQGKLKAELLDLADAYEITGRHSMTKAQLVRALEALR